MTYAGLVKMVKSHFENFNNGPEETPVQGDCSYILTPRATGARGPNIKKLHLKISSANIAAILSRGGGWVKGDGIIKS